MIVDNKIELAWAAGLFEGEGSLWVRRDHHPRLGLHLSQRGNRILVDRFCQAVGEGNVTYSPSSRCFQWAVSGRGAHAVIEKLAPFMTDNGPKIEKYIDALAEGCVPEKHTRWGTLSGVSDNSS